MSDSISIENEESCSFLEERKTKEDDMIETETVDNDEKERDKSVSDDRGSDDEKTTKMNEETMVSLFFETKIC